MTFTVKKNVLEKTQKTQLRREKVDKVDYVKTLWVCSVRIWLRSIHRDIAFGQRERREDETGTALDP